MHRPLHAALVLLAAAAVASGTSGTASLLPGEAALGDLAPGETDCVTFPGIEAHRFSADLRASFEPELLLRGPDGFEIDLSDFEREGRSRFRIRNFPLPSTGTYTLEIEARHGDEGGAYRLTTRFRPPRRIGASGLGSPGDTHHLSLGDLPGGATLRLRARGGILLALEGPSGFLSLGGLRRATAVLPATGEWTVEALQTGTRAIRVSASLRIPASDVVREVVDDAPGGGGADDVVGRTVLVRLRDGADDAAFDGRHGCETRGGIDGTGFTEVEVPEGVDVEDFLDEIGLDGDVVEGEPVLLSEGPEGNPSSSPFTSSDAARSDVLLQDSFTVAGVLEAQGLANGAGVLVAVLDTGILADHPDLAGRLVAGFDLVDGDLDPADVANGIDDDLDGLVDEGYGHGTFVAGLVAAVAPEARILPVRVLDSDARGTSLAVARGIVRAVDAGARVVNLSLGVRRNSAVIQDAIDYARGRDVLVVASAGNASLTDAVAFPASVSDVLTVAAVDTTGVRASFSNAGGRVDLVAPGVEVLGPFRNSGYARWSGTSFATPFASGGAALVLSRTPGMKPRDAGRVLVDTAVPVDSVNPTLVGRLGAGRIQVLKALQAK